MKPIFNRSEGKFGFTKEFADSKLDGQIRTLAKEMIRVLVDAGFDPYDAEAMCMQDVSCAAAEHRMMTGIKHRKEKQHAV